MANPQTNDINTGARVYDTLNNGVSDTIRTDYQTAALGEYREGGTRQRIYVKATAAIPGATCAVTLTPAVLYTAAEMDTRGPWDGVLRTVKTPTNCTAASGAGWNSDAPFAAGEYGWVWRAKTI